MDFRLNDDQLEYQAKCRRFAREVIRPVAAQHDRDESVPWEAIRAAREWGLHGLEHIQLLGSDPEGIYGCIYAEELHWGCAGIALAIQGGSLAAAGIASSGTPEQIGQWVPECFGMGDEIKLGAYAVTEPGAGSDVRSLKTTARQDGDEWVLNGTKVFITNGGIADVTVIVATVDPELGHRGQASFVVPKGTPGLSMGKKESKLGIRASQTSEVILDDCRVPMEYLLGGYDKLQRKLERARSGESTGRSSGALATFELTRPLVGASALGIAQAAYEWTLDYLEDQEDENGPLLDQQRIQQVHGRGGHRDRSLPAARVARLLDGAQRPADDGRAGLDVEAQGGRHGDVDHHHADGPRGPLRPVQRLPAGEVLPRREDLPDLRGHGPGPAAGRLAHAARRVQEQADRSRTPRCSSRRPATRRAMWWARPRRRSTPHREAGRLVGRILEGR